MFTADPGGAAIGPRHDGLAEGDVSTEIRTAGTRNGAAMSHWDMPPARIPTSRGEQQPGQRKEDADQHAEGDACARSTARAA
jgi:hypothetical protein